MARSRVIIVGGGFAGLNCAKALGGTRLDVWVIDKTNHHLFQPLLYQVASAALSPADIAVPIREVLSTYENITVMMGEVKSVEKSKKEIVLGTGERMGYDYLVVATGARHSYFGNDAWEEFAPGLKTLVDALKIRERILVSFEKAERCDSIAEAKKYLNFVIIGGGPTGVELAGAIAEIAYETMLKNFRRIDTSKTRIFLIEGSPHILPVFPKSLSIKAEQVLKKFGVKVLTGKKVTNITDEGVQVDNDFIQARNVIWAAGNQASPLLKTLDVELDRAGRAIVDYDLSLTDHPEVFVLGDASHATDKKGKTYPGLASVALQQGKYVGNILKRQLPKGKRPRFRYLDKGSLATIGKTKAVGTYGKFKFSGLFAWFTWCFIHMMYLVGFKNRLLVLTTWFFSYFADQRGARLVNLSIEEDLPKHSG